MAHLLYSYLDAMILTYHIFTYANKSIIMALIALFALFMITFSSSIIMMAIILFT